MDWRISGAYLESCNCDAICPCRRVDGIGGGRSTHGICFGLLGWRIDDGRVGELRVSRRADADHRVACGIPGYERGGGEYYADELRVDDEPFSWELSGNCAFATDFEYASE